MLNYSAVTDCFNPMDCSPQAPLSMGIFQAIILEWIAMISSRGSSQPRDQTQVFRIAGGFFTSLASREALIDLYFYTYASNALS